MSEKAGSHHRHAEHLARAWHGAFYLVSSVGVLCAYSEWGWQGLLAFACTIAVFAAVGGGCVLVDGDRHEAARAVRAISVTAFFVVATAGLVAVFHVTGLFVAVLVALSSPGIISKVRRWVSPAEVPGSLSPTSALDRPRISNDIPAAAQTLHLPRDVGLLDDEDLCLAWRRSFILLGMARSTAETLLVVERRARILDELHRRSPDGLAAWWRSGGRASGSPLPFLDRHRSQSDPGAP